MIDIYYTKFKAPLAPATFAKMLATLPACLKIKNNKFVRWQDKSAHLFGVLLLKHGLNHHHLDPSLIETLKYTSNNKPYIDASFDFNISHSGDYVVCAISKEKNIGIDVEQVRQIEIDDFRNVFTPSQFEQIKKAADPLNTFFSYWVKKESMIKADGRGFSIYLDKIEFENNTIVFENKKWQLHEIPIRSGYHCALCSQDENPVIRYFNLDFFTTLTDLTNLTPVISMGCI